MAQGSECSLATADAADRRRRRTGGPRPVLNLHRLRLLREVHLRGTLAAAATALGYNRPRCRTS